MAKNMSKSTTNKLSKRRAAKKSPTSEDVPKFQALRAVQKTEVDRYNTVKNTSTAYNGYLARGRGFLKNLVANRRKNGEGNVCCEGIPTDELEKAFGNPPNRWSATALELFLVEKCFNENCGVSTADGIHGAFSNLWDTMDGDRYAGEYSLNEKTGEVRGCPARAASVKAVVKSIKTRAKSKGDSATRNHADAITLEEMKKLMQWSEKECPNELLTSIENVQDIDTMKHRLEHGFMRAFMSSAFTLWTRCFELLSLQANDIEDNCTGPAPYYISHFKVHLTNRKGWQQAKGYDGPRTSNIYDIYKQDIPEIDMNAHFTRWRNLLEGFLGAPLKPNDYLFPHLSINGVIRTTREMSYDGLQAILSRFCEAAGVQKRYTTHSFRRGGAQYRFMFAPNGKRWSLNRIRWWGGWAIGEHVDTLMKYLVDSLQSFENGHGDALHPIPLEPDTSFMGDHTLTKNVTTEEFRQLGVLMDTKFNTLMTVFQSAPSSCSSSYHQPAPNRTADLPATVHSGQFKHYGLLLPSTNVVENISDRTSSIEPPKQSDSELVGAKLKRKLPIPNVSIPSLGRAPGAWRRAIKQWEEKDPQTNLALKDWPVEWFTGEMRTITGSKRSQRQVVFEEFERLGRDESRFLELYPAAERNMAVLLQQIRANSMKGRRSKNGLPAKRLLNGVSTDSDGIDFHGSEAISLC